MASYSLWLILPNPGGGHNFFCDLQAIRSEVLQLLVEGRGNKEIGSALGITTKTAETHRARIMAKLELHSMVVAER